MPWLDHFFIKNPLILWLEKKGFIKLLFSVVPFAKRSMTERAVRLSHSHRDATPPVDLLGRMIATKEKHPDVMNDIEIVKMCGMLVFPGSDTTCVRIFRRLHVCGTNDSQCNHHNHPLLPPPQAPLQLHYSPRRNRRRSPLPKHHHTLRASTSPPLPRRLHQGNPTHPPRHRLQPRTCRPSRRPHHPRALHSRRHYRSRKPMDHPPRHRDLWSRRSGVQAGALVRGRGKGEGDVEEHVGVWSGEPFVFGEERGVDGDV